MIFFKSSSVCHILDGVVSGAWVCALGTHKPDDNGCVAKQSSQSIFWFFFGVLDLRTIQCVCVLIGTN